jgi:hypothetical protein
MMAPAFQVSDVISITNADAPPWLRETNGSPRRFRVIRLNANGEVECAPLTPGYLTPDMSARVCIISQRYGGITEKRAVVKAPTR